MDKINIEKYINSKCDKDIINFLNDRINNFINILKFSQLKEAGCTFEMAKDHTDTCSNFIWRETTLVINMPPMEGKIKKRYLCAYLLDSESPMHYSIFISAEKMKYWKDGSFNYTRPIKSDLQNKTVYSENDIMCELLKVLNTKD